MEDPTTPNELAEPVTGTPGTHVPEDDANAAALERMLSGLPFPATRDSLLTHARAEDAGEAVLKGLANIDTISYPTPEAVSAAVTFLGDTTLGYGHVTVYDQ